MPHITIQMFPGRDQEEKKQMAQDIQMLLWEKYQIEKNVLSVSVQDVPKEKWNDFIKNVPADTFFVKPGYEID